MTETVSDYEPKDGFNSENGMDQCPHCREDFAPVGDPCLTKDGQRYDHITDTEPSNRPFFCPECWDELETNRKQKENQTLGDYV